MIALVAGEKSGDALGAPLMQALRQAFSPRKLAFVGVGGEGMEGEGLESLFPLSDISVMGFSAVIARLPLALTVLTTFGAVYLLWLGINTVTRPPAPGAATDRASQSWVRRVTKGAGVSGLNPKALLLFLAFLPQFLTHGAAWPFAAQIALLGLVHTANCAVVYTSVGATAGRVLRARPAAATAVTRCSGAAMIAIGALLLAEHLLT